MSEIHTWDVAAANNNSASPNGWPENMAYSAVNNSARENMAAAARLYADTNGTLTSGGSSNAYTLTPNRTISAYASGLTFKFKANHSSTGAATINISALGAKDLKTPDGAALPSGYIKQDQWYTVFYQGTYFIVSSDLVAIQAGNTQVKYAYSSTTTMSDPGSGFVRLNNATLSSVTAIAFSDNSGNSGAPDVSAFINSFDDSTATTVKGYLVVSEIGAPENMAIFSVASLTDNAGWSQVTVSHISSNGSFTNNKAVSIHFSRTGDSGDLLATNNLSDLENPATARNNLGLEIGADVQAYDPTTLVAADIGSTVQAYDAGLETGATKTSRKNAIINGNFGVNQREVSGTVTLSAGEYGHDRWKAGSSGCTYTFSTSANVTTITISAGSLIQVIEGVNLFSGTYVLSWDGTAQGKIGAGSYSASGVTGTATGGTNLNIEFNTGALSKVQFEPGSTKTEFERRASGEEKALCMRYYQRYSGGTGTMFGSGFCNTTTNGLLYVPFIEEMRASPTLETSGTASDYSLFGKSTTFTALSSVPVFEAATPFGGRLNCTVASGLTAGDGILLRFTTTTFLALDAEL